MAGYTYLWNLREVWQHLHLATSFHMWHSKQMRLGTMAELESSWGISKQIVRSETYRGDQEVLTWPGVRNDVCSTLGLLLVLGLQAQVRGMALEAQKSCLDLLRRILRITGLPERLVILPEVPLKIESGQVSLKKLLRRCSAADRQALKSRCLDVLSSRR